MKIELIQTLQEISAEQWNRLAGEAYPFTRYEFLWALEQTGCTSAESGWEPQHMLVRDQGELIAALPLYRKHHSAGEYVFDYQWAHAYERYGLRYYPKLLTSMPFTPCAGPRLLVGEGDRSDTLWPRVVAFIREFCAEQGISSWHLLFPEQDRIAALEACGLAIREGVQFQWFNRGFADFDDYLQQFSSKKRKNLKRERRRVFEQGIELIRLPGNAASEGQWRTFYQFYVATYLKRGMRPYLSLEFFLALAETMGEKLLMVLARHEGREVAAALSLVGQDTLFGRYWGCFEEYNSLHFEACYYQGLDYCIEQGLQRFDSGAQGEHKISRGFEPVTTYSAHWIADPQFRAAIEDFVQREKEGVAMYKDDAADFLPFRKGERR